MEARELVLAFEREELCVAWPVREALHSVNEAGTLLCEDGRSTVGGLAGADMTCEATGAPSVMLVARLKTAARFVQT